MAAIPLTVAIIMVGLLLLQHYGHEYLARLEQRSQDLEYLEELAKLRQEFEEYKKRVDKLGLKVGFKL